MRALDKILVGNNRKQGEWNWDLNPKEFWIYYREHCYFWFKRITIFFLASRHVIDFECLMQLSTKDKGIRDLELSLSVRHNTFSVPNTSPAAAWSFMLQKNNLGRCLGSWHGTFGPSSYCGWPEGWSFMFSFVVYFPFSKDLTMVWDTYIVS